MIKQNRDKRNRGVSLFEVLVVAFIFSIMASVILGFHIQGARLYHLLISQSDLRTVAQLAMDTMVNELRHTTRTSSGNPSPNLSIPSQPNNDSIHFYLPKDTDTDHNNLIIDDIGATEWETNNMIKYQYVPGQKELRRLEKGDHRIIANNVQQIEFEDSSIDPALYIDELKIILTLSDTTHDGRTISTSVCSILKLRN